MKSKIPRLVFAVLFLLNLFITAGPAFAGGSPADDFVRSLKEKNYPRAYEFLSPGLKSQFTLERFEAEQKEAEGKFTGQFGTAEILRAEELILKEVVRQKSAAEQMRLGDINLGKLMFWNWWKSTGPKRHFFQFVFGEGKAILFGVDVQDGAVVNYELLPRLQATLSLKNPDITVKRKRVVA